MVMMVMMKMIMLLMMQGRYKNSSVIILFSYLCAIPGTKKDESKSVKNGADRLWVGYIS